MDEANSKRSELTWHAFLDCPCIREALGDRISLYPDSLALADAMQHLHPDKP
jgi:hypothetical protein